MGIGDLGDGMAKGLGDGWDAVKRGLGEGTDWATDRIGDGLERVGAEGVADAVEDWGDDVASGLGATVAEQQLGRTGQADELIHGSPKRIQESARHLANFHTAFDKVGRGMRSLDSSQWKGEAADTFRTTFSPHPTKWLRAADACEAAARTLKDYAEVVEWAQGQAREAIALHRRGKEASDSAVAAYNKKVDAYNSALASDTDPGPRPGPFSDPGASDLTRAQETLAEARRQRDEAGRITADTVRTALTHAPATPPAMDRLKAEVGDAARAQATELTHVAGGAIKGVAGIVTFVRGVNPADAYNMTHPAEYVQNLSMTLSGLTSTVAQPDRAVNDAVDAYKKDPSEFTGRLLPELLGAKGAGAAGGGLRSAAGRGLDDAAEAGARKSARERVVEDPEAPSREGAAVESGGTDPIDLATGKMYLPQTDVMLPGSLPLVFKRRAESGYHLGRFFGPSWSSTVDQRLEIDTEGVVFVHEDGLLLAYPHPAPGVPVLPSHGPRWPLDREADGYTITDPDTRRVWHFTDRGDDLSVLAQIDDRNGNWITFEYDTEGVPASIVHHSGYHLRLTTADGRITALHLAGAAADGSDQQLVRYGYTDGHLTDVTGSSGLPLRFSYDDAGRITSWTDTNDHSYTYTYDDQDRCVAEGGTEGHMGLSLAYDTTDPDTGLRVTTATTGEGHTRRYLVNDAWQVVADVDPLGAVTRYERDRFNRLLSRTDPLGHTTTFRYDDAGNPTRVIRPDGRATTAEYNRLGLPLKIVNPDGTTWRQTYDDRGNRTSATSPAGLTTHFTYDEAGHLVQVTTPQGARTHITCDRAGLPLRITDPAGAVTRYERDPFGRPVTVTDPLGATTHLEWTVEGRPSRRTAPDGSTESWTYDGEGNRTSHTDPMGATSHFEYTHFDLLAARTGPDGVRHAFTHDSELRLTQVTNPQGLTWNYQYDPAGRLISETDFDDRTQTYTHDASGRVTARTTPLGQTIRLDRNALGQVTRKDAAGTVTTFAYDLTDQLTQAISPDTTLTLLRDRFGRLRTESVNGRELSYAYDELGRPVGRTTPTGATSTWAYDSAGNRTRLTTAGRTIDFQHDVAGRELARHIGDELTLAHTFDELGRLTTQSLTTTGAHHTVQHRTYTYRPDGNLTSVDDQLRGSRHFDLDPAGRVTAVHARDWSESYAYDDAGNQTSAAWPATHPGHEATGPRTYTGTRITRAGHVRYEHDAAGRITLRRKTRLSRKPDTWRYTWDAEDRLTTVTTPDGTRWRYTYDPLGRRTSKQRLAPDGETVLEQTDFTWDATTLCEQTTTTTGQDTAVTLTWNHQGLHPLTQTERITAVDAPQTEIDSRFFAIVTDLVGTPTELIDDHGDIAWHTRTTLWGTTTWNRNATTYTPLRFPGQYYDPETGLHHNYFRTYDPETARYLTPDPLGLTPSPNPATYVHNPHAWTDPLGLAPCREFFTVQSPNDASRLRGGGEPWPSEMHRAHFGEGVYSWSSRNDAEGYFAIKSKRTDELEIVRFTVPAEDFAKLSKADISRMTDDEAQAFIDRYSLMSETGVTDHGFQYITRPTNLGSEHFFSRHVMHLLNFN